MFRLGGLESFSGIPDSLLNPRSSWSDPDAYDTKAAELAEQFAANEKTFDG